MQKYVRLAAAAAVIGLGIWGWWYFFPGPDRAIRNRLNRLALAASFTPQDGALPRALGVQMAAGYFTLDARADVNVRGYQRLTLDGRDDIQQALAAAARQLKGFHVEFLDLNITLEADQLGAKVNLTAKWTVPGQRDFDAQEFNFFLKKVDGNWLIYRVETVQTLSFNAPPFA